MQFIEALEQQINGVLTESNHSSINHHYTGFSKKYDCEVFIKAFHSKKR